MGPTLFLLDNSVQNYAWGSRTAISSLLGRPTPSEKPEAELWIGAHPKAPSRIKEPSGWGTLQEAIAAAPVAMLGPSVARRHGGELPFLFKVLAAAEPLSIQSHPNLTQAREGFERENHARIPIDAPNRNYRDANHKPELVAPLTPFLALEGFRPVAQITEHFALIPHPALGPVLAALAARPDAAHLREFFETLMTLEATPRAALLAAAAELAATRPREDAWTWLAKLQDKYPGDIGALAPLYLNLVQLQPGEALYLPAGELHAYLEGTALEIMANSDNVLRGGLTPKHVDVTELVSTLSFRSGLPEILRAEPSGPAMRTYRTPASEFELSIVETSGAAPTPIVGACILLGLEGDARIAARDRELCLTKGRAVFVPACLSDTTVSGVARLACAAVPARA